MFEFEGLKFKFGSFTLLAGPMAAAKPIFAQKFIVKYLNENEEGKVIYFATSSPVDGIIKNLNIFGIKKGKIKKIIFLDYNPEYKEVKKVNNYLYRGNFSEENQLITALNLSNNNSIVVIPSFTLLLLGCKDKFNLANTLIKHLSMKNVMLFVAVNSNMFGEVNQFLKKKADNVIEFSKEADKFYFEVKKFSGEKGSSKKILDFPIYLFEKTKKEVAKRTSQMIMKKKTM